MRKWIKRGKIFELTTPSSWWKSHAMAPSAIYLKKGVIRIYLGCWDENKISRIGFIDVDAKAPNKVLAVSSNPVLNIGRDGMFDENGVFPAHASVINGKVYLYYTGFQLGFKIEHYNFGGLAISEDGLNFKRVSEAPVLDRQDEGLFVRAGQSVLFENNIFKTVYSVGSGWAFVGGKKRPTYNVCYQQSEDGINYKKNGKIIAKFNLEVEHGLGRPQIVKVYDEYVVFYTRRMIDMKYYIGCSKSKDCVNWKKDKAVFSEIKHSKNGFDSEMIYFPSVIYNPDVKKYQLFYCGNGFGKTGIGFAELI